MKRAALSLFGFSGKLQLAVFAVLGAQAAAQSDTDDAAERRRQHVSKYSASAFRLCDEASEYVRIALAGSRRPAMPSTLVAGLQSFADETAKLRAAEPYEAQLGRLAKIVKSLDAAKALPATRSLTTFPEDRISVIGSQIAKGLTAYEESLDLPDIEEPFPQLVHGDLTGMSRAYVRRELVSMAFLALAEIQYKRGQAVMIPERGDFTANSESASLARDALARVTPWCQPQQFALAYLQAFDESLRSDLWHRRRSRRQDENWAGMHEVYTWSLKTLRRHIAISEFHELSAKYQASENSLRGWTAEVSRAGVQRKE